MKLEMTEKDKRLLIMLSIFVIVVCIGYWGVYPVIKDIIDTDKQIEEQKLIKEDNQYKLTQIPMLEADNDSWKEDIQSVRESFFPMMKSADIDEYFTDMVLGYNLSAYDLSIQISADETDLEPYIYSQKAYELSASEEASSNGAATGAATEQSEIEQVEQAGGVSTTDTSNDSAFTEPVTTGIYEATVTMRLGGDEQDLLSLIEDLSNSDMKIRVCNYSWSDQRSISDMTEDGDYNITVERVLTITLEIYMYQEQLSEEG